MSLTTAANDTRPLQPLTFLAAAIRAECADARRIALEPVSFFLMRLTRIEELCTEIERHAEGKPNV